MAGFLEGSAGVALNVIFCGVAIGRVEERYWPGYRRRPLLE